MSARSLTEFGRYPESEHDRSAAAQPPAPEGTQERNSPTPPASTEAGSRRPGSHSEDQAANLRGRGRRCFKREKPVRPATAWQLEDHCAPGSPGSLVLSMAEASTQGLSYLSHKMRMDSNSDR